MVAPRADEQTGGALFQPSWAQAYLRQLFQQRGINPSSNMWARQVLDRASQATYMMNAMGLDENQARGFLQSWMNGRWGGGDQTFNGTDLSRQGMSQWLDQAMRSQDQSTEAAKDQYAFFNTGDPEKDFNNLQAANEIRYGGRAPGYQQAHQRVLNEWFGNAQAGMLANPAASTNTLDWWYNRAPTTAYGATPPPGTPGAPPGGGGGGGGAPAPYSPTPTAPGVNPNLTTFPTAPGNPWQPLGTPPATTPAGWTATPGVQQAMNSVPFINVTGFDQIAKNRRTHPTAPGKSNADLGYGFVYSAPSDVQRKYWEPGSTGREPGGQAKGESGWRLFTNRMAQLQAQGMTYQQALANTMQWLMTKAGGDMSRFGFRRVG